MTNNRSVNKALGCLQYISQMMRTIPHSVEIKLLSNFLLSHFKHFLPYLYIHVNKKDMIIQYPRGDMALIRLLLYNVLLRDFLCSAM